MTCPSVSATGLGLRFTFGDVSFSISEPGASIFEGRGIWSWNSKLHGMSWTLGKNPVEAVLEVSPEPPPVGPGQEIGKVELRGLAESLP